MRRLPSLKSLQAFRYAAQHASFKTAAEQLFVTQAAISQQIKTLEQELGVELFERQTRQVVLTHEGRYLYQYTKQAFELLEAGVKGVTEDPNPNTLVISALPSFASRWLVARIGRFQALEKNVSIRLNPSLDLATFTDSDLDLSIRFGRGEYEGLQSELLFEEVLIPVCHPSLIDPAQPLAPQLTKLSIIKDSGPDVEMLWSTVKNFLQMYDMPIHSQLQVSDSTALIEGLLSGQGLAMVRFGLIYELLRKGLLISPIPVFAKSSYHFYLVAPPSHFNYPKVDKFRSWIRQEVQEIKEEWQEYLVNTPNLSQI